MNLPRVHVWLFCASLQLLVIELWRAGGSWPVAAGVSAALFVLMLRSESGADAARRGHGWAAVVVALGGILAAATGWIRADLLWSAILPLSAGVGAVLLLGAAGAPTGRGRRAVLAPVLAYLAVAAYGVGGALLGRAGAPLAIESLLLLALLVRVLHADRGAMTFSSLCQLVALLVLCDPDVGGATAWLVLGVLPLLGVQLMGCALVVSVQSDREQQLRNRLRAGARARRPIPTPRLDLAAARVALIVLAALVGLTGALNLLLPRPYAAARTDDPSRPPRAHGDDRYPTQAFPQQIDFRALQRTAPRVFVAEVRLRRSGEIGYRARGIPLYWRMVTYDRFDGRRWHAETALSARSDSADGVIDGRVELARAAPWPPPVVQEVAVVPIQPPILPLLDHALSVERSTVHVSPGGAVFERPSRPPGDGGRLRRFRARSQITARTPRVGEAAGGAPSRYAALPRAYPRVLELARTLTRGARTDTERVDRVATHLRSRCRYARQFTAPGADPIQGFLFDTREGHCELFAGALVVLLRSIGIPCRVVGGFQGGVWREFGQHYVIRGQDAHAWAEVHYTKSGWVRVDPTPAGAAYAAGDEGADRASTGDDATDDDWSRSVLFLDARTRQALLDRVPSGLLTWLAGGVALALAGTLGLLWLRRRRRPDERRRRARAVTPQDTPQVAFYRDALAQLAEAGVRRTSDETPAELARRVGALGPTVDAPFARITGAYLQVRFGGRALSDERAAEITALLAGLPELLQSLGTDRAGS